MSLRVIDTGLRGACDNVAMTAQLLEARLAGRIPDTLRFHRYRPSFLLGYHQLPERELDVERCAAAGVEVVNRLTGGAAVYMNGDVLAWDFVSLRNGQRPADITERAGLALVHALKEMGLAASANDSGDILVDGRKVGGCAGCWEGRVTLVQGMLFLRLDRRAIAHLLRKQSVTRRARLKIAGLADFLGCAPSLATVQAAMLAQFSTQKAAA